MFCPKCGSNQGDGKKFCTVCGTNLLIVSQALTGQLPQAPVNYLPPALTSHEIERQSDLKKGTTMAVLGGGYLIYNLISFAFSLPFRGWHSPFGPMSFLAFIFFAIGLSKIVHSRASSPASVTTNNANSPILASAQSAFPSSYRAHTTMPQAVFSVPTSEPAVPRTSELEPVQRPAPSVTEEETRQLSR